jgi:hypothetical protein
VLRRAFARFASICAFEVIELRVHRVIQTRQGGSHPFRALPSQERRPQELADVLGHAERGHSLSRRRLASRRRNSLLVHTATTSATVTPSWLIGAAIGEFPFRRRALS